MASSVKVNKDHNIPNADRRDKIGRFLTNLTKFAIDFVFNVSSKGVTSGKKVHKMVHEGLKNQPCSPSADDKKMHKDIESAEKMHKDIESAEKMQAKMEEMQETMNNLQQQNKTSVKLVERSKPEKNIPNNSIKGSDLLKANEKRIFIRSRL